MMKLRRTLLAAALVAACVPSHAQESAGHRGSDGWFSNGGKITLQDGQGIYDALCAACHMEEGSGAVGAGAYPALARNPNLAGAGYVVAAIVRGQKAMPALGSLLNDEQVVAVVNYVRTHLGNDYQPDPATLQMVRSVR